MSYDGGRPGHFLSTMRHFSTFLLAVLTCLSLGSCAILGGGSESEPVEATESVDGGIEDGEAEPVPTGEDIPPEVESSDDPEKEPETTTLYSTASLRVRSGRGTSHPVVAGLTYGEMVEAGNLENGWFELFSNGRSVGFALADYLSAEKPAAKSEEPVPRASRDMGLFGIGLPTGSALIENVPLTEDADARQAYRVPMSAGEIRGFFVRELASLGWNPQAAPTGESINYRKGDLVLTVEIDGNGQRFTLTGGHR